MNFSSSIHLKDSFSNASEESISNYDINIELSDSVQHTVQRYNLKKNVPRELFMDILLDSDDLLQLDSTLEISRESHILKYPHREATTIKVTGMKNFQEAFNDPFLTRIALSHNKMKRDNPQVSYVNRRRIDFLTRKDSIIVVEFTNEFDYWQMNLY